MLHNIDPAALILLVFTALGVAFLKGIPVGPLIAAGILSLFVGRGG